MNAEQQEFAKKILDPSTWLDEDDWIPCRTQEFLHEIIKNKDKITSPAVAEKVGWILFNFAFQDESRKMIATSEVYDTIINFCAKFANKWEPSVKLANTIAWICEQDPNGSRLFQTPEVVSFFISTIQKFGATQTTTSDLSWHVCRICSGNPAFLDLFATSPFVAAHKNAEKYATTPDEKKYFDLCAKLLGDHLKQKQQQQQQTTNTENISKAVSANAAVQNQSKQE
jgi:hypothetical protein